MYLRTLETREKADVYERLYEENRQRLYFLALKILRNELDAEDAVHNGFVRLADKFDEYEDLKYEDLIKLITIIVRNAAMDIGRDHAREAVFWEEPEYAIEQIIDNTPNVLDRMVKECEMQCLICALKELGEEERELLYMQYILNMKPNKIGSILGVSSGNIRKRSMRARNKLEEILRKELF